MSGVEEYKTIFYILYFSHEEHNIFIEQTGEESFEIKFNKYRRLHNDV